MEMPFNKDSVDEQQCIECFTDIKNTLENIQNAGIQTEFAEELKIIHSDIYELLDKHIKNQEYKKVIKYLIKHIYGESLEICDVSLLSLIKKVEPFKKIDNDRYTTIHFYCLCNYLYLSILKDKDTSLFLPDTLVTYHHKMKDLELAVLKPIGVCNSTTYTMEYPNYILKDTRRVLIDAKHLFSKIEIGGLTKDLKLNLRKIRTKVKELDKKNKISLNKERFRQIMKSSGLFHIKKDTNDLKELLSYIRPYEITYFKNDIGKSLHHFMINGHYFNIECFGFGFGFGYHFDTLQFSHAISED